MRGRKFRPRALRAAIWTLGTPLLQSLETPLWCAYLVYSISTTSRLYIGLAVRLYVFTIFHIFSLMFKLLYLCRERPNQETDWRESLVSSLSVCMCNMILHKRSYASILSFEKLHYFEIYRTLSDWLSKWVSFLGSTFSKYNHIFRTFCTGFPNDYNLD